MPLDVFSLLRNTNNVKVQLQNHTIFNIVLWSWPYLNDLLKFSQLKKIQNCRKTNAESCQDWRIKNHEKYREINRKNAKQQRDQVKLKSPDEIAAYREKARL